MGHAAALRVALELVHMPSRVRTLRSSPLPEGVGVVLQIAAGDEAATAEAVEVSGRPREVVHSAAAFFIEQMLLCPEADSYRALGATKNASAGELRRNMALLLRWLHPDVDRGGERSIFAGRVTRAWEDLKTPDRRAAYDSGKHGLHKKKARRRHNGDAKKPKLLLKRRPTASHANSGVGREEQGPPLRRLLRILVEWATR
jgi:hypothetical protein